MSNCPVKNHAIATMEVGTALSISLEKFIE